MSTAAPERVFDRVPKFDPRSRNFPITAALAPRQLAKGPRNVRWTLGQVLDQGSEGACVGFAWAHELGATPRIVPDVNNQLARAVYYEAQHLDEWSGVAYSGTSVLAGVKAVQARRLVLGYHWAFGLEQLKLAVSWNGPVVLGLNWYSGMLDTNPDNFIVPTGSILGGHAILCYGINLRGEYFWLRNSWGIGWGWQGACKVHFNDMDRLLREEGEACVATGRTRMPRPSLLSRISGGFIG